jgi:streptomycin 6-kinase
MLARVSIPRHEWAAALPDLVASVAARWELDVGAPFQPGGTASWVAPATPAAAGEPCVLKIAWQHNEGRDEAEGLRVWNGNGTVRLLRVEQQYGSVVMLLEACRPGTPLGEAEAPEVQDVVVAGLLRRLWGAEVAAGSAPWRPLSEMCDWWADEYERRYERSDPERRLDPGVSRAGIELFRSLPRSSPEHDLLATDLHAGNVLAAEREPWLAVDPKPYVGDPAYDVLQHMLNHRERLASDPSGFARRMAGLCELDPERVERWLFARCVQESFTWPELSEVASRLAP